MYALRCFICAYAVNIHATKTYLIIHKLKLQYESTQTPWTYQGIGVMIIADKN